MNIAIITAAGKGTRLKSNISKQFLSLYGKPILAHTLDTFQKASAVDQIYLVVSKDYYDFCNNQILKKFNYSKVKKTIFGGKTRQQSVYNALIELPEDAKTVTVHDGVRPLVTSEEVSGIIQMLTQENQKDVRIKGIIMAAPACETIKKVVHDDLIDRTIQRDMVWHAQTPQVFFYPVIIKAHKWARRRKFVGTDDASLVERLGHRVKIFRGRHENIKITTPMDLFLAELIMRENR